VLPFVIQMSTFIAPAWEKLRGEAAPSESRLAVRAEALKRSVWASGLSLISTKSGLICSRGSRSIPPDNG
jgi:hypothetical protein